MTDETRGWIYDGAPIAVIYSTMGSQDYTVTLTTIKKVSTQSLTVHGNTRRFRLDTLHHRDGGYGGYSRIVHPDDPIVSKIQADTEQRHLLNRARARCDDFLGSRTEANRQAAISALSRFTLPS
jgi:hypothetical protein